MPISTLNTGTPSRLDLGQCCLCCFSLCEFIHASVLLCLEETTFAVIHHLYLLQVSFLLFCKLPEYWREEFGKDISKWGFSNLSSCTYSFLVTVLVPVYTLLKWVCDLWYFMITLLNNEHLVTLIFLSTVNILLCISTSIVIRLSNKNIRTD